MDLLSSLVSELISALAHLGLWAYVVIFIIAFADSLIVAGTFTAGSGFLLLAGVLVSRGVYSLGGMALAASLGAIMGGIVSYRLGRLEAVFARKNRWFPKEKHLEKGSRMLARHGGASIFIARFLGPLSSMIAFMAGTARMPLHRFLFWNFLAGASWGIAYVFMGALAGTSLTEFGAL